MVQIKPGRYTNLPKGYITYPYNKTERNSNGLANILLTEDKRPRYIVGYENIEIEEKQLSTSLSNELVKIGCNVKKIYTISTCGRKTLTPDKLPVEIRKIMKGKQLQAIRIRVAGETEGKLLDNMKKIKNALAEWQINPTECVWSQGDWKTPVHDQAPIINQEDIIKEQNRLKNIVADLEDKLGSIEKPHLKKRIFEERQVMKGILH